MSFINADEIRSRIDQMRNRLNHGQLAAVNSILNDPIQDGSFLLPIVDGPPGTGKTTVGAYASIQSMLQGISRGIIYVTPTNFAAMQAKRAFEGLGVSPRDVIWLNPRSMEKNWERGIVGVRWDLSDLGPNDIRLLRRTPVLICTPYMLGRIKRGHLRSSDIKIIIDEFSQIDPAVFFMVVSRTGASAETHPRGGYALLGDPLQLPVVTTQQELLENIVGYIISRREIDGGLNALNLQHRMHEEICNAVNRMRRELSFWHDFVPLESSNEVKRRDLTSLGYRFIEERVRNGRCLDSDTLREILDPSHTYIVINTDRLHGINLEERMRSGSLRNIAEAEASADIAIAASQSYHGQSGPLQPVIISPYNAQVNEIQERLRARSCIPELSNNVLTAWSSQGREFPMVIVSLVRNNLERNIGFLEDERLRAQVYVACSRAMAKLIVLISRNTFGGRPIYEELVRVTNSQHTLVVGWD
ncbi:MAG: AAA domain-containing protein [candidate division WOR-3 bacterium]